MPLVGFSQKEANNWYFGNKAGLNFNATNPTALLNSQMTTAGASSTISSSNGRVLFYLNSNTIWDSTHNIMSNGSGLKGDTNAMQATLILPMPDSNHLFYVFMVGKIKHQEGLTYSVVNMNLNSGKGEVVSGNKNIPLFSPTAEKLTAVAHSNGIDYWLLVPKYNTDTIYTFLITNKGISNSIVKSVTGLTINGSGPLKISPNGKKIALTSNGSNFSFFADFDPTNGVISNVWELKEPSPFGIEFSGESNYLYLTINPLGRNPEIIQFKTDSKNKSEFLASRKIVDSIGSGGYGNLQLAPNGKIYVGSISNKYLHTIHSPDSFGYKCRPKHNDLYLGGRFCNWGLPNFIQSYFEIKSFLEFRNCINDTTFFTINSLDRIDSVKWEFGDTNSLNLNYSYDKNKPYHIYNKSGYYQVKLTWYHKYFSKTFTKTVFIKNPKPNIGKDTSYCNDFVRILNTNKDYISYKWSNGGMSKSLAVYSKGVYWVNGLDSFGCWSSDTIRIANPRILPEINVNDSTQCLKGNSFVLKNNSTFISDSIKNSIWYYKNGVVGIDSFLKMKFSNIGSNKIQLITESKLGCKDSIIKELLVHPQAQLGFQINDSVQCFNEHSFNFINSSNITGDSLHFDWDLADIRSNQTNVISKVYNQSGSFNIKLISFSSFGCSDTLSKGIKILSSPLSNFNWGIACSKSPVQFNFTGSTSSNSKYLWIFPNGQSNLRNPTQLLPVGKNRISLELENDFGCKDSIDKEIEVLPQAIADFLASDVCEDSFAKFENISKDALFYRWNFGDGQTSKLTSPKHQYSIVGSTTFNVTLFAKNECSDSITKSVTIHESPNSDYNYIVTGNEVKFSAALNDAKLYEWDFGDGVTKSTTISNITYTYDKLTAGTYKACLTTSNLVNCTSKTCYEIQISNSIKTASIENEIKIYPNPNNGNFIIEVSQANQYSMIEIFDNVGKSSNQIPLTLPLTRISMDLKSGIYFIKLYKKGEIIWDRISVSH